MIVTDLINVVRDTVRRPDLHTEIDMRTLAAITTAHGVANFIQDREEITVSVVGAPSSVGSVPIPRDMYRLETVVPVAGGALMPPLKLVSPAEVLKLRTLKRDSNTGYSVGGAVSYKCEVAPTEFIFVGYMKQLPTAVLSNPNGTRRDITDPVLASATTWLMQDYPISIIDLAIGQCEALLGNTELASLRMQAWNIEHKPYLYSISTGKAGQ